MKSSFALFAVLLASAGLEEAGFLVPAIRYPTVSKDTARLRISLSAAHSAESIRLLAAALARQSFESPVVL